MSGRDDNQSEEEPRDQPGERFTTLAHELNQPLAAIRINAQAALRFLDGPEPDLDEVRTALQEIIEDDRRAADLVRRLLGPASG